MREHSLHSILAATDLGAGSDSVVQSAATLARRTGARLHLVHAFELRDYPPADLPGESPSFPGRCREAEQALDQQIERVVPPGVVVASRRVVIYAPFKVILDRAAEVSADLVVLGPHRGGSVGAQLLGTTADRVIRSASVPCLVTREPLTLPLKRIGVPTDFSDASQAAVEEAFAWAGLLDTPADGDQPRPEVWLMHAGWPVDAKDDADHGETSIRPALDRQIEAARAAAGKDHHPLVVPEVLWGVDPREITLEWIRTHRLGLVVMGTHGRSGLKRALIGSMASSVVRQAPCPVLLVPPSLWARSRADAGEERPIGLRRVAIGVDFSESSLATAHWVTTHVAPAAEHVLVHCVEVPEPPGFLAGRFGPHAELVRTAHAGAQERLEEIRASLGGARTRSEVRERRPVEGIVAAAEEVEADLIALGEHASRHGAWGLLGSTAEGVLHASAIPVLVRRGDPGGPPRTILAATDGSDIADRALRWACVLANQFEAELTVLHVVDLVGLTYAAWGAAPAVMLDDEETRRSATAWLEGRLGELELGARKASIEVAVGDPRREIGAAAIRNETELLVIGSHGAGGLRRALLGSVAGAVLRSAPCPVLVVPPRGGDR